MSTALRIFTAAIAATLIASCSTGSLFDSDLPVPRNFVLAPVPPAASTTTSAASKIDLIIGRPDAGPGLDSRRIAVLRGRELDYYAGNQWGGTTIEVVQALLVASIEDQKLFRSVTPEQARVSGDYLLDVEIRDFQAEYPSSGAAPQVHVTLLGRIIRIADRQMIGTLSSTALESASADSMSAVAAAFEAAAQKVALDLAQRAATNVAGDSGVTR